MTARPTVVVLVPIAPSATGNGLAMRTDLLVRAVAAHHDVVLAVVPMAGRSPVVRPTVDPVAQVQVSLAAGATTITSLLSDPVDRQALERASPVPPGLGRVDPAAVVTAARGALAGRSAVGVLVGRLGLAWAGWALARALEVPWAIDLDDDDEAFHRADGREAEAAAWGRVAAVTLPTASLVVTAAPADAAAVAARHGREVGVLPNAVAVPPAVEAPPADGPVVLVGNLTYGPNVDGAVWLVQEVLPRLAPDARVLLVGPAAPAVRALAGSRVEVTGAVEDTAPHLAAASVVAVPVRHGSGTRIKVLEAMAAGRPVVSTRAGAAGLLVVDGEHLQLADSPEAFAAALARARDAAAVAPMLAAARALVGRTYDAATVAARTGVLLRDTFCPSIP